MFSLTGADLARRLRNVFRPRLAAAAIQYASDRTSNRHSDL